MFGWKNLHWNKSNWSCRDESSLNSRNVHGKSLSWSCFKDMASDFKLLKRKYLWMYKVLIFVGSEISETIEPLELWNIFNHFTLILCSPCLCRTCERCSSRVCVGDKSINPPSCPRPTWNTAGFTYDCVGLVGNGVQYHIRDITTCYWERFWSEPVGIIFLTQNLISCVFMD